MLSVCTISTEEMQRPLPGSNDMNRSLNIPINSFWKEVKQFEIGRSLIVTVSTCIPDCFLNPPKRLENLEKDQPNTIPTKITLKSDRQFQRPFLVSAAMTLLVEEGPMIVPVKSRPTWQSGFREDTCRRIHNAGKARGHNSPMPERREVTIA